VFPMGFLLVNEYPLLTAQHCSDFLTFQFILSNKHNFTFVSYENSISFSWHLKSNFFFLKMGTKSMFSLGSVAVLGIRIRIQIRKDPNVLKDPNLNPIKLFGFGSGSERIRRQILYSETYFKKKISFVG